MGHPILLSVASLVDDPTDPEIGILAENMVKTMLDAGGVGLAAPQVYVSSRIITYYVPKERVQKGENEEGITVLINPTLKHLGDKTVVGEEGCLSLPGMSGMVRRHYRIAYKAVNLEGQFVEREVTGYHARIIQHEFDHLNGILYPMRMDDLKTFGYRDEIRKVETD